MFVLPTTVVPAWRGPNPVLTVTTSWLGSFTWVKALSLTWSSTIWFLITLRAHTSSPLSALLSFQGVALQQPVSGWTREHTTICFDITPFTISTWPTREAPRAFTANQAVT